MVGDRKRFAAWGNRACVDFSTVLIGARLVACSFINNSDTHVLEHVACSQ